MNEFAIAPEALRDNVIAALGDKASHVALALGEVTVTVDAGNYIAAMNLLRTAPNCRFDALRDLCGVDYLDYGGGGWEGPRFAVVVHLLSIELNQRVRVRVFCPDNDFPQVETITGIWAGANWFEREAFDLFGIAFKGHNDLRRILTDYGFIGHPFRKDFPLEGYVEMRYDAERQRVVYEPVSIEPREVTPRIVREESYGGLR